MDPLAQQAAWAQRIRSEQKVLAKSFAEQESRGSFRSERPTTATSIASTDFDDRLEAIERNVRGGSRVSRPGSRQSRMGTARSDCIPPRVGTAQSDAVSDLTMPSASRCGLSDAATSVLARELDEERKRRQVAEEEAKEDGQQEPNNEEATASP